MTNKVWRRPSWTTLLVGLFVAGSALWPGGSGRTLAADQTVAIEPAALTTAELSFREMFGLGTDPQALAAAAASRRSDVFEDIRLTAEEEALMLERGRIQQELAGLRQVREQNRDRWGGMWLAYPPGGRADQATVVHVALTGDVEGLRAQVEAALPRGADIVVHSVRSAESTLDALHEVVVNDRDWFRSIGTDVYSIATDVKNNSVEIGVAKADEAITGAIADRYAGVDIAVVESSPPVPDTCSRTNCGPPWLGGLKIARTNPTGYCTSNFIVHLYQGIWTYAMWTAGHCTTGQWRQGTTTGTVIGTTASNYFVNGSDADVQVIPLALSTSQVDDYLYGSETCVECIKRDVRVAECKDCDEIGEIISNNGAFSGIVYGEVANKNVTFLYPGTTVTLYRQRRGTYTREPGDSGGPVTALSGVNYDVAVGSHTHYQDVGATRYAIYSHVAEMEEKTGWSVWVNG